VFDRVLASLERLELPEDIGLAVGQLRLEAAMRTGDEAETVRLLAQGKFGRYQVPDGLLDGADRDGWRRLPVTVRLRFMAWLLLRPGAKHVGIASVLRLVRLARSYGTTRVGLEFVAGHFASGAATPEALSFGWAILASPEYREGHEDLRLRVQAHMAASLLEAGREREAWGLLRGAIDHFRSLERKLMRGARGAGLRDELYDLLCRVMGISRPAGEAPGRPRIQRLEAQAYRAVTAHLATGTASGVDSNVPKLAEILTGQATGDALLDELLALARTATGARRALLITNQDGKKSLRRISVSDGADHADGKLSWATVSKVIATNEPEIYEDALAAEQLSSHRSVAVLSLRSLACLPLRGTGEAIGVLYLDHHGMAGLFGEDEVGFLSLIGSVAALSIEGERKQRQLNDWEGKVTESHRQLIRSERNRLAGQIASGLAHDLKNVLATIVARCQLMAGQATAPEKGLRSIERAAYSANKLLEKLQESSREHLLQREDMVDVAAIAHEALELLSPRFVQASINVDAESEPAYVRAVPGEIRELFLNLLVNACDALPYGGNIRVAVRLSREDRKVIIEVADTGTGMPDDVRARIFEPFFTTKSSDGTGLGLAVVKSIVVRYAGSIDVESALDEGTRFSVRLPECGTKKTPVSPASAMRTTPEE
jgi:signal transduction histidine kinase